MNKNTIIKYIPTKVYLNLRWWDFKVTRHQDFLEIQKLRVRETTEWGSYKPFDEKGDICSYTQMCRCFCQQSAFGNLAGGHTTLRTNTSMFMNQVFF